MHKLKVCSKCKKELNINNFTIDNRAKDKLLGYCKQCVKDYQILHKKERKIYLENNKQKFICYRKKYYQINKEKAKQYYQEHKIEVIQKHKNYYEKNKEKILYRIKIYQNKKIKIDINFRLAAYLRTRIWHALKGNPKLSTTMKLVGCNIKQLKHHLEKQFIKGMTWKNYGKWEIDHIRPCASFDLSKPSEQKKCFYYKNLQPLWKEINRRKQGKI
jgi:hypothetical protein